MDISTIIGLISGLVFVIISIILGEGRMPLFINMPSVLIVFGGVASALMVSYPIPKL